MIACFDMGGVHSGGSRGGGGKRRGKPAGGAPDGQSGGAEAEAAAAAVPVRVADSPERDRFAAGAPSVVPADAPCPRHHRPRFAEDEIVALFARKTAVRERGIAAILDAARAEGRPVERFTAAIRYDCELAPRTTNRRQLAEIGVDVPLAGHLPGSPAEVHRALWCVIYGLARLGIFLTGTDRLDDRALLAKLSTRILDDEVGDIPPSADMSEFIDVDPALDQEASDQEASDQEASDEEAGDEEAGDERGSDERDGDRDAVRDCRGDDGPDGLHGPFDYGSGDDEDDEGSLTRKAARAAKVVVDRDRLLPRPDRR